MTHSLFLFIAILLRILSNPVSNVFQKQLTAKGHHPLLINFLTYFLLSVFCLFIAQGRHWLQLPPSFWWYSFAAGLAGALGNSFLVKALQKGELSVLGPINSYKSIVGMIAGIFLLHEVPNLWGVLGMAVIICGSYFVLDTTEDRFSWNLLKRPEIQYRLWAMLLTAIEAVFLKKIILFSSVAVSFISWCWFGAFFSALLLPLNGQKHRSEGNKPTMHILVTYLLLITSVGTMQATTNYVFNHIPVGYALSLFQLSTLVSVWLGHAFFNEKEIGKKVVGSVIMILGSVLIILLKN